MKTLFQFLAGGACGLFAVTLFWLGVFELDDEGFSLAEEG